MFIRNWILQPKTFTLIWVGLFSCVAFAEDNKSNKVIPPKGSTCWSKDTGGSLYPKECEFPDGSKWECTDDLGACKRVEVSRPSKGKFHREVFKGNPAITK